jgi:hypothetical protein
MMLIQSLMGIIMFKKDISVDKTWSKQQLVRFKNAKIFVTMILYAKHLSSTYFMNKAMNLTHGYLGTAGHNRLQIIQ